MIGLLLIVIPLGLAACAAIWPHNRSRPWFLPLAGLVHTALCAFLLFQPLTKENAWIGFDALSRATLPAVSLLFLACSAYGVSYLKLRENRPNRVFVPAFLSMLGLMGLALQARHLGLLWIAVEGVTLSTVPLVHFNNNARAYEATWKYLLVGGTGIALSLLGSFALGYASLYGSGDGNLSFDALISNAGELSQPWTMAAWVLILVGYGTKMGLAPMHTWKPDVYGEAPGIVGAMLAGGVTTVAFTAILRIRMVVDAAGGGAVTGVTLLVLGLFSVFVASLFLLATRDFKRMLAYSSIENMGILCIGASLGGIGLWAAFFHAWNNIVTKGSLFLSAGNLRRTAGGRTIDEVRGMMRLAPRSAILFVAGLFGVTACPPFGPFFSELTILKKAFSDGHIWTMALFLFCLLLAFCGMSRLIFAVVDGRPRHAARKDARQFGETFGVLLPPAVLLAVSILLGLFTPPVLRDSWQAAVDELEAFEPSKAWTAGLEMEAGEEKKTSLADENRAPEISAEPVAEFVENEKKTGGN